ncbi:hypothetical protein [Deinococcus sp.]|uniref:hypothetical protein n=1 Tax=Deinococcus sp. TaxID=47478 RepID=UPI003C7B9531
MEHQERSCYIVELSSAAGGRKWKETHAYSSLEATQRAARQISSTPENGLFVILWHGATYGIWIIQQGQIEGFTNLHSYTTIQLPENPVWHSLGDEEVRAWAENAARAGDWEALDKLPLRLDWEALEVKLSPLRSHLLQPGEEIDIKGTISAQYGSFEQETGTELDRLDDVSGELSQ